MDDCQSLGNFAWPSILIMRYHEVDLIYFFSAVRYWLLFMVFECSSAQVCMFVKVLPECATWPHTHVDTAGRDRDKSHRAWMLTTKDAAYTKVAWLRFTHTRMRQAKMYRTVCTWCLWDQPNWKQDLTLFLTFCKNGGIPGKTWHPLTVFFHNDIYQQILRCMQCTFADTSSLFSGISVCQYYLHPKKMSIFSDWATIKLRHHPSLGWSYLVATHRDVTSALPVPHHCNHGKPKKGFPPSDRALIWFSKI